MASIFRKLFLSGFVFFIISVICYSQVQNQITLNDSAHLIKSGFVYEAEVLSIYKFRSGFGFFIKVNIKDNIDAYGFVVSSKGNIKATQNNKKSTIRKGDKLKLILIDYFNEKLGLSIEYKRIYDVMLCNQKVVIPAGIYGMYFSRIFVSPQIESRYFIDYIQKSEIFSDSNELETNLISTVCQIIKCISFENEFENLDYYCDTLMLKESLQSFSFPYFLVSPDHSYNKCKFHNARRKSFSKMDWNSNGINPDNFFNIQKGMLQYFYKLPLIECDDRSELRVSELKIRLLYKNDTGVTVEVKWSINNFIYTIVLTLSEYYGLYKVTGMNTPLIESCRTPI